MNDSKRWRRVAALLAACALVLWVDIIAWSRWDGVPATPYGVNQTYRAVFEYPVDPARDRSQELKTALSSLPPLPKLVLPQAPEGKRWEPIKTWNNGLIDLDDANNGAWTPATRPNLQGVIAYLKDPATEDALDKLAAIRPGVARLPIGLIENARSAEQLLVARARLNHAGRNDVDAALGDLETAYRLGAMLIEAGEYYHWATGCDCQSSADVELRHMAFEIPFGDEQAKRAREIIDNLHVDSAVLRRLTTDIFYGQFERILDSAYTKDGDGNGWLVLSAFSNVSQLNYASKPRSGAWNVVSVLFNDRKTVTAKLETIRREMQRADTRDGIKQIERHTLRFSFLDGPLAMMGYQRAIVTYPSYILRYRLERDAAQVALALSAWHTEHGAWPASLDELVGVYLDEVPPDPNSDGPLRYLRRDDGTCLLYSTGPDGSDDGGIAPVRRVVAGRMEATADQRLDGERSTTYYEPALEDAS